MHCRNKVTVDSAQLSFRCKLGCRCWKKKKNWMINKMAWAHNKDSADARLDPSTSKGRTLYTQKRKSRAYTVKVPSRIWNLNKWMKLKICYNDIIFLPICEKLWHIVSSFRGILEDWNCIGFFFCFFKERQVGTKSSSRILTVSVHIGVAFGNSAIFPDTEENPNPMGRGWTGDSSEMRKLPCQSTWKMIIQILEEIVFPWGFGYQNCP